MLACGCFDSKLPGLSNISSLKPRPNLNFCFVNGILRITYIAGMARRIVQFDYPRVDL